MGSFMCSGVVGLMVGLAAALWYLPASGRKLRDNIMRVLRRTTRGLQTQVEAVVPADPIAESIAQGKAAARRRRDELGLV